MYSYVKENEDTCRLFVCLGHDDVYDEMLKRLAKLKLRTRSSAGCGIQYWFDSAVDAQIAANTFKIPIAIYAEHDQSLLYLPYDLPDGQPQPQIMHFVNGNHFQTIKTKRYPTMICPPVQARSMTVWESRGGEPKVYKAAWKYIHRKKNNDDITSIAGSSEKPIVIENNKDDSKSQRKTLEELYQESMADNLEPEVINPCPFCLVSLGDPMPDVIKKAYDEYF
ncbi:hypothetical protein BDA99DRAFT_542744 [Phascolomyces articulosus]|uniref:OTU domain-containing protein n=1 Tax=Phascolomyces articulosus TaxID=60185 RepID=A0AAD5JZC2_9FUNG|nr:hypothetical protein BDA99DRAFT_542744 [Phascolomyces articulosus]